MQSRLDWLAASVLGLAACNAKTDSGGPPPAMSQARVALDARGVPLRGLSSADRAAMPAPPTEVGMPGPKTPGPPGPKPAGTAPPPAPAPPVPPATGMPGGGTTEEHLED